MKQVYLESADDMTWLRETHLRAVPFPEQFKTALITGNEDCPERIALWRSDCPMHNQRPDYEVTP